MNQPFKIDKYRSTKERNYDKNNSSIPSAAQFTISNNALAPSDDRLRSIKHKKQSSNLMHELQEDNSEIEEDKHHESSDRIMRSINSGRHPQMPLRIYNNQSIDEEDKVRKFYMK